MRKIYSNYLKKLSSRCITTSRKTGKTLSLKLWMMFFRNLPVQEWQVVSGTLFFYREGAGAVDRGAVPEGKEDVYTCRREIVMSPGDQITLPPGEKHWFQARDEAVVMYSFSTVARDVLDGFTDPAIERVTRVSED